MIKKEHFLLFLILIIGFSLRFYKLAKVPAGFLNDEAAIGYNAYSLIKTGRDEFGESWPLFFRSFGEGKLTLLVYEALLPVFVFGLSEFSVRFMPAFLGFLTVFLLYFLTKELLEQVKKKKFSEQEKGTISLLAAFSLAVLPWHLHFSRAALNPESLFWVVFGTWLFLRGIRKKKLSLLVLSFVSFTASQLIYHAARVFAPPWAAVLISLGWHKMKKIKRLKLVLLYFVFIIVPAIVILKSPIAGARTTGISLFHHQAGVQIKLNEAITECKNKPFLLVRGLHNKVEAYLRDFGQRYFAHFNFDFLFFDGDPLRPRYRVPNVGQMLLIQAPFFLVGLYLIFHYRLWLVLAWLFLAPLPAAITFETPSSVRAIFMTIPLTICSGLGFFWLVSQINFKNRIIKIFLYSFLFILFFWNFSYYLDAYYFHQEVHQPYYWQYGYKELVVRVNKLLPHYNKAVITDSRGTPYIFFLFYNQYPPEKFQAQVWQAFEPAKSFSFVAIRKLDNLEFVANKCPAKNGQEPGILYVCTEEDHPQKEIKEGKVRIIDKINYQDGQPAFVLMEWVKEDEGSQ